MKRIGKGARAHLLACADVMALRALHRRAVARAFSRARAIPFVTLEWDYAEIELRVLAAVCSGIRIDPEPAASWMWGKP